MAVAISRKVRLTGELIRAIHPRLCDCFSFRKDDGAMSVIWNVMGFAATRPLPRRDRRGRPRFRVRPMAESLDPRVVLSVTFTGNVLNDFNDTVPGLVVARPQPDDPRYSIPLIEEPIRDIVRVSGFQLDAIRLVYDAQRDILQVGFEQPLSQQVGRENQRVIAGDADNNGNGGTVNPTIRTIVDDPDNFIDFPSLGGTETMLAFFHLDPGPPGQPISGTPDIVAGIDAIRSDPEALKSFQVAEFNTATDPTRPGSGSSSPFGRFLPQHTGASLLGVTPEAGGFEFNINRFSELYQNVTGRPLQFPVDIAVGGFAGSANDGGISEAFIPPIRVTLPAPPPPPVECPPQSPPVLINPHQQQHINTFHDTRIRVYIFGTFGFDTRRIVPESVRLGGAAPVFDSGPRRVNADQYPDRLFVFNGRDVDLPRGPQDAVVTGLLDDGTPFVAAARVYNQPIFFTLPQNRGPVPLRPLPPNRRDPLSMLLSNQSRALNQSTRGDRLTQLIQQRREAVTNVPRRTLPNLNPSRARLAAQSLAPASPLVLSRRLPGGDSMTNSRHVLNPVVSNIATPTRQECSVCS